jgi:hypothetical protein
MMQPQNQIVKVGATATFSVVASGTAPLSYQWSKNGTVISNATSASYTTPATVIGNNGESFTVTVSNVAGSQTSNAATLTVNPSGGGTVTPIMFQHIASSTNPTGVGIPGHAFVFHTESLPANTVAVMGVSALANVSVSISDTLAGSWSAALCSGSGGAGNTTASVFVQPLGASGGTDTITIDVGPSDTQPVQFDITFWQNINTSSPTNGALCKGNITAGAGGAVSPGSFTPTMNNDANGGNLIWNYTPICTGYAASNPTSWVPASGFSLLNGDIVWTNDQGFPEASQYYVQSTQASVTPSITATGDTADCFNSASVALQIADNGASPPSSIHVVAIGHESFTGFSSPGTMNIQVPWVGNLRALTFTWLDMSSGEGPYSVTSISSSDGCNFTETGGDNGSNVWYAQGCSPCPACTVSLIWTGGGNQVVPQASFRYYDVQNAQTSSFQNAATSDNFACGTTVTDEPMFTPTGASSGLVIQVLGNGNGPITGFAAGAPTGAVFDLWTFADQNDTDVADNADSSNHLYYSSTATENWNFVKTNGSDFCYDAAAAFN